jgi:hypothetical protein
MPCVYKCKSPFGAWRSGPCKECMAEADRIMDEQHKLYQEAKAYTAFRLSEATDREWRDHIDQVAPVVRDRKIINGHVIVEPKDCTCDKYSRFNCPVCDGGLSVCINCGAAEIELDQPCKANVPVAQHTQLTYVPSII